MENRLKEYNPPNNLRKYIDSFWFFRNNTGGEINFPVVPDGCSDIIYYLNNSKKLADLEDPLITGIMEFAELIPVSDTMELFGIRFKPGVLWYILKTDMKELKDTMCSLSKINKELPNILHIDRNIVNEDIISGISERLEEILIRIFPEDNFLEIVNELCTNPETAITELAETGGFSVKTLERTFSRRIGLSPKKFARIMRFQNAHRMISRQGLANLVKVALSSGYFDQSHFNREYKKLVGFNPNNNVLSILYNI